MSATTQVDLFVTMDQITLGRDQLEALASEYYGVIPVACHTAPGVVCLRFHDLTHSGTSDVIRAEESKTELIKALDGFLLPPSPQI